MYETIGVDVTGRTPSYVSPFSSGPQIFTGTAPAAGSYDAQYRAFYYPITVPSACVIDKFWVASQIGNGDVKAVACDSSGRFVVLGSSTAAYSDTGVLWARTAVPAVGNGVANDNAGTWVGCGNVGYIFKSTNGGVSWSSSSTGGFGSQNVLDVAYGNGYWVAVGTNGSLRYSTDPMGTWSSPASSGFGTSQVNSIAYANGTWVAVANGGQIRYATDPTGTWTSASSPGFGASASYCVAYGNGVWVAVGSSGTIRYATDPTGTWTSPSSPGFSTQTIYGVAYNGTAWVAVANSSYVRYATDPTGTWSAASNVDGPSFTSIYKVAYGSGKWVAVGAGLVLAATDPQGPWQNTRTELYECGLYSAGRLIASKSIDATSSSSAKILYSNAVTVSLASGSYELGVWSSSIGISTLYRSSSTSNRLRARFMQDGLTSGLPATMTPAQETSGNVYLFGFTTK